jgi:hypothetical protein
MKYTTLSLTKEVHDRLKTFKNPTEPWNNVLERLLNHYERDHKPPAAQPPTPNETALTLANEPPKNTEAD